MLVLKFQMLFSKLYFESIDAKEQAHFKCSVSSPAYCSCFSDSLIVFLKINHNTESSQFSYCSNVYLKYCVYLSTSTGKAENGNQSIFSTPECLSVLAAA